MKKSTLIVIFAAFLNVILVAAAPKNFSGGVLPNVPEGTERFKSIVKSISKGLPVSIDDLQYRQEQSDLLSEKRLELAKKHFSGKYDFKITAKSFALVSAISLSILVLLSVLGYLGNTASLVSFSIPSMFILLIAPIGSGQLFLIIIFCMLITYAGAQLFKFTFNTKQSK